MKAKDLMIGDWVYIPHNGKASHYGRVTALLSSGAVETEISLSSSVEPIPLTPEILEKNSDGGFFYHDSPIIGYNGKRSTHHIGRASLYVEWERISMKPYIEIHGLGDTFYKNYVASVHDLQHALHDCGIEKEITI